MAEQFDLSEMTVQDLFRLKEQRKSEQGRRLAKLPIEKKIEMVEKFNAIIREALREDEQRRASQAGVTE